MAPFFIKWGAATKHPSTTAPGGCEMPSLKIVDPASDRLSAALGALAVSGVTYEKGALRIEATTTAALRQLRSPHPHCRTESLASTTQVAMFQLPLGFRELGLGVRIGIGSRELRSGLRAVQRATVSFFSCRGFVEELVGHFREPERQRGAFEIAVLRAEPFDGHDRLGHRAVAAGGADVGEPALDEFTGVARVAQVPHADDQRFPTKPAMIVHLTSSSCRKKSAVYGMKSSRGASPRNA